MKHAFSRLRFEKYSNIKFHENPTSGRRVVSCRWTDKRIDMAKLTVAFRNFLNAPANQNIYMYKQPTPSGGRNKIQRKNNMAREKISSHARNCIHRDKINDVRHVKNYVRTSLIKGSKLLSRREHLSRSRQ
jgi:hypothetical protein